MRSSGAHIFYRWAGGWGRPAAFAQAYAGREPSTDALRSAALSPSRARSPAAPVRRRAEAIADIPGAERSEALIERGDGRVAVRFNLAARKAVDEVEHKPYVEKVAGLRQSALDAAAAAWPPRERKAARARRRANCARNGRPPARRAIGRLGRLDDVKKWRE